jgi:chemotaxis protein CheZ
MGQELNQVLERARALVVELESGNGSRAELIMDDLARLREASLFQELGRMTRDLHEALKTFHIEARVSELAERDIPSAQQRLTYVVDCTEKAAHTTLSAVEDSIPLAHDLTDKAREFKAQAMLLMNATDSNTKQIGQRLDAFLSLLEASSMRLSKNLSDVMMAQEYQDLTGQIIRRVIDLVQEVEKNLVELVRLSGQRFVDDKPKSSQVSAGSNENATGAPYVPGVDKVDIVTGQDEVDELLSSLGF